MDNASNMVLAVRLNEWNRLLCFGHRLHLAIGSLAMLEPPVIPLQLIFQIAYSIYNIYEPVKYTLTKVYDDYDWEILKQKLFKLSWSLGFDVLNWTVGVNFQPNTKENGHTGTDLRSSVRSSSFVEKSSNTIHTNTISCAILLVSIDSSHWLLNRLHVLRSRSSCTVKSSDMADTLLAIVLAPN
ncbi:hypothetical protein F2P81_018422 [Scophthalmus maximus]|uniref:Uncharacterized protein n=1 Tax=Scophthalmus maximus TaxID=52904 RepID=A0A6A4S873_SCOMX|nr:hypothetical protein F2P81_018422 [Scophthalmus maximus]